MDYDGWGTRAHLGMGVERGQCGTKNYALKQCGTKERRGTAIMALANNAFAKTPEE